MDGLIIIGRVSFPQTHLPGAFSGKVVTGFPQKMRPTKEAIAP
jgi:hypothetical protein